MKKLAVLVLLVAVVGVTSVCLADANDPNTPKAKQKPFIGKVVVVKDAEGVITAVQIENRKLGKYNVVLDEKGKELGEKMEGKLVAVKGVESVNDEEKWITVESYREIQRAKGRDGKKDSDDKGATGGKECPADKGCKADK